MIFKQTPNFTKGDGTRKIGFVIHGTLGNYDGAVGWLCVPPEKRADKSYSSAHYVIAKDGRCTQLARNEDVTWHAGNVKNPSPYAQSVLPKNLLGVYKNPNTYFIGIECEWFVGDKLTDAQYKIIFDILKDTGIVNPIIIGHKDIASYKADDMEFACKIIRNQLIKKTMNEDTNTTASPMTPAQAAGTTGNATIYEVVEKVSKVAYPVTSMAFGDEVVSITSTIGNMEFTNKGKKGLLENEHYVIREIGTHLSPDGTTKVEL